MGESSRGTHEWLIEFEKEPDELQKFTRILDDTLKSINSDYEAKRYKDINLVMPLVKSVPTGTFTRWLKLNNVECLSCLFYYVQCVVQVFPGMRGDKRDS